jgi:hypothetical protein
MHPTTREEQMKIKLNLETLSVESFATGGAADSRGTVQAHQQLSDHCNTRQPFCLLPSINLPCITDEVECG